METSGTHQSPHEYKKVLLQNVWFKEDDHARTQSSY